MQDIHSLPDSLREQIQEAAASILPASTNTVNVVQPGDPLQRIISEIARQSPELFAALIVANSGCCGIETVETEETIEDQVVSTYDHRYGNESEVRPMKTLKTIRRQVRFLTERSKGLRERP